MTRRTASKYRPRWCGPKKCCWTLSCAAAPIRCARSLSASRWAIAPPACSRLRGSAIRTPDRPFERLLLECLRPSLHPPGGAIGTGEHRLRRGVMGEDPGGGEDRQRLLARLTGVLGGERVDRGSDHGDPLPREALPGKPGAGEHERVRVEHVASQEAPGLAGIVVGVSRRCFAAGPLSRMKRDNVCIYLYEHAAHHALKHCLSARRSARGNRGASVRRRSRERACA
jgi:hypothetical protein